MRPHLTFWGLHCATEHMSDVSPPLQYDPADKRKLAVRPSDGFRLFRSTHLFTVESSVVYTRGRYILQRTPSCRSWVRKANSRVLQYRETGSMLSHVLISLSVKIYTHYQTPLRPTYAASIRAPQVFRSFIYTPYRSICLTATPVTGDQRRPERVRRTPSTFPRTPTQRPPRRLRSEPRRTNRHLAHGHIALTRAKRWHKVGFGRTSG